MKCIHLVQSEEECSFWIVSTKLRYCFEFLLGCPSGWKQHGKQCYYFGGLGQNGSALAQRSSDPSLLPQSWKQAEELCQDEEAHLTSVRTEVGGYKSLALTSPIEYA